VFESQIITRQVASRLPVWIAHGPPNFFGWLGPTMTK